MDHKVEVRQVNMQSLSSTQRMVQYLSDADSAAIDTMTNLETQGEQLNRVENNLDKIDLEIRQANENITQLDRCCGLCLCPCRKSSKLKDYSDTEKITFSSKSKSTSNSSSNARVKENMNNNGAAGDSYIKQITGDEVEQEMKENMESVSSYLQDLKSKARAMGTEIEYQNEKIDRINAKVQMNKVNIERSDKHANDVLSK